MSSVFVPTAGARFGSVLGVRPAGDFVLRLSRYPAGARMPPHHHVDAYFSYVVEGGADERVGARRDRYAEGSVHFHPAGEPHSGRIAPLGLTCLSITPHGDAARGLLERGPRLAAAARSPQLAAHATRCWNVFRLGGEAAELSIEHAALELVAALHHLREITPPATPPRWLATVLAHLEHRFAERLTLRGLAALAGVHEVYLARAFRRHLGEAPGSYVRRLRVEAARAALAGSAQPIADIALASGFSSQSHLTRVFRRQIGMPPAAYRRRHGRRAR